MILKAIYELGSYTQHKYIVEAEDKVVKRGIRHLVLEVWPGGHSTVTAEKPFQLTVCEVFIGS